jgi:Acetyltransferase (GNAT) domain
MHCHMELIDPTRQPNWDSLVLSYPECTFFHSAAWARVLSETYGYRPIYFVLRKEGQPVFLFPVMEVQSWLTGKRAVSLPFTDFCEPLGAQAEASQPLVSALMEEGAARRWRSWQAHGGANLFGDALASVEYSGHVLDLSGGVKSVFTQFAGSVRQCLKGATRAGVTVRTDNTLEGMRLFYRLHCRTRKKHGVPPQPFRFFENIQRHVLEKGMGWLIVAEHGTTPIAAALFFHFGRSALYKFGASDERHLHLRGNHAVMWEAIRCYATNGYRLLHFGRTSNSNQGLRRFKLGWGAQETRIRYYKYDLRRRTFVTTGDPADSSANRLFRILPLTLSRLAGALAYRHIAS